MFSCSVSLWTLRCLHSVMPLLQLPEERDDSEERICILTPGSTFSASLYKTPNNLKGYFRDHSDVINPYFLGHINHSSSALFLLFHSSSLRYFFSCIICLSHPPLSLSLSLSLPLSPPSPSVPSSLPPLLPPSLSLPLRFLCNFQARYSLNSTRSIYHSRWC